MRAGRVITQEDICRVIESGKRQPCRKEGEEHTVNWQASETLSGVYKFKLVLYIYVYIWRYVCHNSRAWHAYVMWAE